MDGCDHTTGEKCDRNGCDFGRGTLGSMAIELIRSISDICSGAGSTCMVSEGGAPIAVGVAQPLEEGHTTAVRASTPWVVSVIAGNVTA